MEEDKAPAPENDPKGGDFNNPRPIQIGWTQDAGALVHQQRDVESRHRQIAVSIEIAACHRRWILAKAAKSMNDRSKSASAIERRFNEPRP